MANKKISVQGTEVKLYEKNKEEYISLTDMARKFNDRTDVVIQRWLRNRNTIEFMAIWEELNNPEFNPTHLNGIRQDISLNSYVLSVKQWIELTGAVGIESRAGRYGGTYAHRDIAFEFGTWLSPVFKMYLIKEFQLLKEQEAERLDYDRSWSVRRELTKINYRIHTDAVKLIMPPKFDKMGQRFVYANEADLLNLALFGKTAKKWKDENSDKKGNIRDHATIEQLTVLANLENLNAYLIENGLEPDERVQLLNQEAIKQMDMLLKYEAAKNLKKLDDE